MNDFNFCTVQIGLMYPNMSSLNKILEIESLLYNISIMYNINFDVESFIEKPDIETAEKFVKYGDCFWNSGQFVFNIEKLKQEIKQYQKEAWRIFSKMKLIKKSKNLYITDNIFLTLPNLQIDKAIIEKSRNLLCCKAGFDWVDIGSFEVLKYLISVKKIQTVGNYFNV